SSPHRDRGRSRRRHRGPNRYGPGGRRGSKRTTPASVNCAHDPKRAAHPGLTARKDLYVLICPSCHFLLTQLPSEDRRLSRASATSAPPSAQPASPRRLCRLKWLDSIPSQMSTRKAVHEADDQTPLWLSRRRDEEGIRLRPVSPARPPGARLPRVARVGTERTPGARGQAGAEGPRADEDGRGEGGREGDR